MCILQAIHLPFTCPPRPLDGKTKSNWDKLNTREVLELPPVTHSPDRRHTESLENFFHLAAPNHTHLVLPYRLWDCPEGVIGAQERDGGSEGMAFPLF